MHEQTRYENKQTTECVFTWAEDAALAADSQVKADVDAMMLYARRVLWALQSAMQMHSSLSGRLASGCSLHAS